PSAAVHADRLALHNTGEPFSLPFQLTGNPFRGEPPQWWQRRGSQAGSPRPKRRQTGDRLLCEHRSCLPVAIVCYSRRRRSSSLSSVMKLPPAAHSPSFWEEMWTTQERIVFASLTQAGVRVTLSRDPGVSDS